MSRIATYVRHKAKPGRRDDVRRIWEKYARDYVAGAKEISIKIKPVTRLPHLGADARHLTRFVGKGGRVLAEVPGLEPRYAIRGDEGYVRASIVDSNGRRAWTQPVFLDGASRPAR